ncbi:hypothetical protein ACIOWI_29690 [Streptomyces sp. NPDC087659]|uniref:hypothetical protein n=1 Tax=Streptomyces sp. NPDC087659 TaxID=3365801 RepID=UPI0038170A40
MSWWSNPLTGTVVGGVIASATQWITTSRQMKKEQRREAAEGRAQWSALQTETIRDLQEQLEEVSTVLGTEVSRPVLGRITRQSPEPGEVLPYARAVMLCSRLENRALADDVLQWLRSVREALQAQPLSSEQIFTLRDQRLDLQKRLGATMLGYHRE